ncbi:DsbA family protein [Rhodococcus sp. NPDC127530]|uniref:DsbA family protein n=1 Tax=unclassified Rhodococcus (in: high G+C Gram-positive bacteria) TaxID=192944 RepID=UPI00363D05FF
MVLNHCLVDPVENNAGGAVENIHIDVWMDLTCPYCYLWQKRLRGALAAEGVAERTSITVRSFELDPEAPVVAIPAAERMAARRGLTVREAHQVEVGFKDMATAEGLDYDVNRLRGNTGNIHRVNQYARESGKDFELFTRIQEVAFTGRANPFETEELVRIAVDAGLDEAGIRDAMINPSIAVAVEEDRASGATVGLHGVPHTVINSTIVLPGMQSAEDLQTALRGKLHLTL